ncbi:MAG TPA: hypothetical protein ENJ27_00135 [Candidatus Moranbacteria bacterium]|nr:hypothetical protein [Candidatus Moranbacteria bacterium]
MHNIYNTEGIVLSSFGVGEANKFFHIFTRELGLIQATAQSVRELKSKNRYGLQDFSVSDFSLVRGRDIWRITNVLSQENLFFLFNPTSSFSQDFSEPDFSTAQRVEPLKSPAQKNLKQRKVKLSAIVNIFSLLKQFIHGEEKNEELFDIVFNAIDFLKNNNLKEEELEGFDLLVKMRILNNLGYFNEKSQKEIFLEFFKTDVLNKKSIKKINLIKKEVLREINNSLEDTHLL